MRHGFWPVVPALLLLACGDEPLRPGDRVIPVHVATLGTEFSLDSLHAGATDLAIVPGSEVRWLDEAPVVDTQLLRLSHRLRATAPGRISLTASGATGAIATLEVTVAPTAPILFTSRDTLTRGGGGGTLVRGYRMFDLAGIPLQINGSPAVVTAIDSATGFLAVPSFPPDTGCRGLDTLTLAGVLTAPGFVLVREITPALSLPPGQVARLTPEAAACLRLAAASDSTRWAVAWLEPTAVVDSGPWAPTGYQAQPGFFQLRLRERGAVAPTTVQAFRAAPPSSVIVTGPRTPASAPWLDRPTYAVGDTLTVTPGPAMAQVFPSLAPFVARVYGVLNGRLVLLAPDTLPAAYQQQLVTVGTALDAAVARDLMPLLDHIVDGQGAGTAAGWYPVAIMAIEPGAAPGRIELFMSPTTTHLEVLIRADSLRPERTVFNLAGVMTQSWFEQASGPWQQNPAGVGYQFWGVQGAQEYLAYEVARRATGIAVSANFNSWDLTLAERQAGYMPDILFDPLVAGWMAVSGRAFIRDQIRRLMAEAGMSERDATRLVIRGALGGIFGCYASGCTPGRGLALPMRAALGTWEPVNELLTFALAQSADDLTAVPRLQNAAYLEAGSRFLSAARPFAWATAALLTQGRGDYVIMDVPQGSLGYVVLADGGTGGVYELRADRPVEWAIVRIR